MPFASKDKQYVKEYNKGRYSGEFKKRQLEKVSCECGAIVCRAGLSKHKKSKRHVAWVTDNEHKQALNALEEQIASMMKKGYAQIGC